MDFPASSPYVTGLGGTEFPTADVATANTQYWTAANGNDVISSAVSYIPEMVWNDDSANGGLSSGGGGASILFTRPTWQNSAVPGIGNIAGSARLVPDVALSSSPANAGYLYCSSDTGSTGIEGSCTHGFRDANNVYLTSAGGTSFAAPVFAGMLAIINQATKNSAGQGVINGTLYALASNPATYASAFHDITSGNNECTAGSSYCTSAGLSSFAAGTGYDEASGLGSVDLYNLLTAWPVAGAGGPALTASTITLTPGTTIPKAGAADTISIAVGPGTAATGTVSITVNGGSATTVTLTNGVATYTFTGSAAGQYVVVANYSGNTVYAASSATLVLQVGSNGTFAIAASSPSISDGSSGTSTITVTPSNGYTGTVNFSVTSNPTLANVCYTATSANVTGATASGTLTIYTNQTSCGSGTTTLVKRASGMAANTAPVRTPGRSPAPVGIALAGLLAVGFLRRRSRGLRSLLAVALLGVAGYGLSGCGSGTIVTSTLAPSTLATKGVYTIVVQGTDSANAANTSFATFTLTVQ